MEPYQQLEDELGQWAGYPAENVVACSSGTAALHLALEAFRLPAGSEVILGDFNMIACPRAVSLAGLMPVFVDCDDRLLMDLDLVRPGVYDGAKTRNTSAVMAVHIYGRQIDMGRLHECAEPRGLAVIEDMAEIHGVRPHPRTDAACYSFFRNKIVAGEEGGAVLFRDPAAAALARMLRCQGFTPEHDYRHIPRGHNYRLANALAKPILESLAGYRLNVSIRRGIEWEYEKRCPPKWLMPDRQAVWVYDLRIPGLTWERQTAIVRALNEAGIAARHGFKPMHTQEEYKGCRAVGGENALKASLEVLYLPANPGITEADCRRAFDVLTEAVSN